MTDAGSSLDEWTKKLEITSAGPNSVTVPPLVNGTHETTATVRSDGSFPLADVEALIGGVMCPHPALLSGNAALRDGGIEVSVTGPVPAYAVAENLTCPTLEDASLSVSGRFERL
jgi:hypothetical protein